MGPPEVKPSVALHARARLLRELSLFWRTFILLGLLMLLTLIFLGQCLYW